MLIRNCRAACPLSFLFSSPAKTSLPIINAEDCAEEDEASAQWMAGNYAIIQMISPQKWFCIFFIIKKTGRIWEKRQ
jgi:hypothetical protein